MFDKLKETLTGAGSGSGAGDLGGYAEYVKDVEFPIDKDALLDHLQANGATEAIVEHVRSMSRDRFDSAEEIFATLFPPSS